MCSLDYMFLKILQKSYLKCNWLMLSLHPESLSYPLPHVRGIRVAMDSQNKYSVLNKGSFCVNLNILFSLRGPLCCISFSLCAGCFFSFLSFFFTSKSSGAVESACTM